MPGRQHMGLRITMILGLVGAWLGGLIGPMTGMYQQGHPAGSFMALVGALIGLFIYTRVVESGDAWGRSPDLRVEPSLRRLIEGRSRYR